MLNDVLDRAFHTLVDRLKQVLAETKLDAERNPQDYDPDITEGEAELWFIEALSS